MTYDFMTLAGLSKNSQSLSEAVSWTRSTTERTRLAEPSPSLPTEQWDKVERAFHRYQSVAGKLRTALLIIADTVARRAASVGLVDVRLPRHYLVRSIERQQYLLKCAPTGEVRFVLSANETVCEALQFGLFNDADMMEVRRDFAEGWMDELAAFIEERSALETSLDELVSHCGPHLEATTDNVVPITKPITENASAPPNRALNFEELGRGGRMAQRARRAAG
jgi:hypothetical protein